MKQNLIWVVAVLCVICLLIATAVSIGRAKHFPHEPQEPQESPEQPSQSEETTEQPSEEMGGMIYFEYTGQLHPGTGIAYRGSGANASYVIVIDAGHQIKGMSETEPNGPGAEEYKSKVTGGTQGSVTGLAEYELNLRVAIALRDVLVAQGYTVVMVRETNEVAISNAERAQLANQVGADVNIRIHANGADDASVRGAMMVCQTPSNPYNANIYAECRALSDAVLAAYCESTAIPMRNVWETDTMTGTNWATVPTTILEMGFMTNAEDDTAMAAEGFAAKAAKGIAKGIADYFAQEQTEPTTNGEPGEQPERPTYTVDTELEASFGMTFTETYVTMQATGNVWVRSEPSSAQGMATAISVLKPGDRVICVGLGEKWNRVLINGKVYYVSAAYLQEVNE